jgi:uncharacterized cofD-like protein
VSTVRGQVEVATTPGELLSVTLEPRSPVACAEAVAAVREADWVVLGPGSWYTSVIPHLLVPDLREALETTAARLVVTMNLEHHTEETRGYSPEDHLGALLRHAPRLPVRVVLADPAAVPDSEALRKAVEALGAQLVLADVARAGAPGEHDPEKLARAYARLMKPN